jgi:hypothetical protein
MKRRNKQCRIILLFCEISPMMVTLAEMRMFSELFYGDSLIKSSKTSGSLNYLTDQQLHVSQMKRKLFTA